MGRSGWSLDDYMYWHGEGCVTVNVNGAKHAGQLVPPNVLGDSRELTPGTISQVQIKGKTKRYYSGSQLEWNDIVHRAKLQRWEVIALRLYTGPMYN
jgi:hypothetical protein